MNGLSTSRPLLIVLGVAFLPYGLYCFGAPQFLEGAAGLAATTPTAVTEVRAMYGGLQAAFGLLMLAAARDARLTFAGLAAAAFVMPGLAVARTLGALAGADSSAYTVGALVFEIGASAAAVRLYRQALPGRPPS